MRNLLLPVALAWALSAAAAPPDSLHVRFPFLQMDLNRVQFPGGEGRWALLREKVARIRAGSGEQLHVLHIGGSHVQAGTFPDRIREGLSALVPPARGAARGFFFPYALTGSNGPGAIKVHATGEWHGLRRVKHPEGGPYGMSAFNACTSDPFASVHIQAKAPGGAARFRAARIFADLEQSALRPESFGFVCPDTVLVDREAGFWEWRYAEPQDALEFVLLPDTALDGSGFTLQGVQFLDDRPALVHHVLGVNGATLHSYLSCERFERQLAALKPDLVILGIGVNDANAPQGRFDTMAFEMRYDSLLQVFCRANPEVSFLFLTNNDTYYHRNRLNRNGLHVRDTMLRVAAREQAAVWDQLGVMGGLGSIRKWEAAGLAKADRIHLTAAGYSVMAELLSTAVLAEFPMEEPTINTRE